MTKIKPFLTLITAVLLCMNLQTQKAYSDGTIAPTMMPSNDGGGSGIAINGTVIFEYALMATFAVDITMRLANAAWQKREYIYDAMEDKLSSYCGWCIGKKGHPLDSVRLSNLPEDMVKDLRSIHDSLSKTKGVVATKLNGKDWLYELKENNDPKAHTYRSFSFKDIRGVEGAVDMFSQNVPEGKYFNKGRPADDGEIYKLLSAREGSEFIDGIARNKDAKLTRRLLSGFPNWKNNCNIEIVKGSNTHYVFLGNYAKSDATKHPTFTPSTLFTVVAGNKPNSDLFDDEGKLTFDITYGMTKRQVFNHYYGGDDKGIASTALKLRKRSARKKKDNGDLFKVELDDDHKKSGKKSKRPSKKSSSSSDSETEDITDPLIPHPTSTNTKRSKKNEKFNPDGDDFV